jgi:hypothetical protein
MISSSNTIIFPYLFIIVVTPSITEGSSPQFFSLFIIVIFLNPSILSIYFLTSSTVVIKFLFLAPSL